MIRIVIEASLFILLHAVCFILYHISKTPTEFIYYNF